MEATNEIATASATIQGTIPYHDASTSSAFWMTARDFHYAARLLHGQVPNHRYMTVYFYLVCHSVEASLKGLLRAKG